METSEKNNTSAFNLWEYLYYRTTKLYSSIESRDSNSSHQFTGALAVALFLFLNTTSILFFITFEYYYDGFFNSFMKESISNEGGVAISLLWFALIWYVLVKKRHQTIFQQYENESLELKRKRGWMVFIYMFFSEGKK